MKRRMFPEQYPFRNYPPLNALIHFALLMAAAVVVGLYFGSR